MALQAKGITLQKDAANIGAEAAKNMAGLLGMTTNFNKTAAGGALKLAKGAASGAISFKELTTSMGNAAAETFNLTNLLGSVFEATKQFILLQDQTTSSFVAATGASREYGQMFKDIA